MPTPQPTTETKLCECGCGEPAPISKYNDKRRGVKRGEPVRFIWGHGSRVNPNFLEARRRSNERRCAELEPRRQRVAELYRAGVKLEDIAADVGSTMHAIAQDIERLRREGVDLPFRNIWTEKYVTEDIADKVEESWEGHFSIEQIAERFGWSWRKAQTVVLALRRAGYRLDRRNQPVRLHDDERRTVVREFKKQTVNVSGQPYLRDGQKAALRLLQAASRPLATGELGAFLRAAGMPRRDTCITDSLRRLQKRGLVERVEALFQGRRRAVWFVPLGAERPAAELTLADAERETELATLVRAQEREMQRGEWVEKEGHAWFSLDAPRGEDGSWLDTIEDVA